jgi:FixJ family two-component response regulator
LWVRLSERELDVLRLPAAGDQNQEIADELYLTLNTVMKHVTHIFVVTYGESAPKRTGITNPSPRGSAETGFWHSRAGASNR